MVAAARFQVMALTSRTAVPASGPGAASRVFVWYFLAANNRRLAMAVTTYPDTQSCFGSVRELQLGLPCAVGVLVQVLPSRWEWRVRVDGADRARSQHGYPRRVRAQLACDGFLALAAVAADARSSRCTGDRHRAPAALGLRLMRRSLTPRQLTVEQAGAWRDAIVAVENARVDTIAVAIRRTLKATLEQREAVDMLLDAVIAWENLVGGGGEQTLRISGALAWLLEDDVSRRILLRQEIAKLYGLRSKVVHGSAGLPKDLDVARSAQRALELATRALRALLVERPELLKLDVSDRSAQLLMGG